MIPTKSFKFFALLSCLVIISSCRQVELYEKNASIPSYKWPSDFAARGSFIITDTQASYKIFVVLRHLDSYAYNNIWLNVGLQAPGDSLYHQRLDLSLGTDAGGWEGTGMNDIWEVRKLLSGQARRFIKPGTYNFEIKQLMRENPLNGIMSAGLRLEKLP